MNAKDQGEMNIREAAAADRGPSKDRPRQNYPAVYADPDDPCLGGMSPAIGIDLAAAIFGDKT